MKTFSKSWKGLFYLYDMKQSLQQNERLKHQKLIERLFEEGRSVKVYPVKAVFLEEPSLERTQAAFSVPKRTFQKAVERNRIKRLMREAYRKHREMYLPQNGKKFAVLFIYLGQEMPYYSRLESTMNAVLKKCF